MSEHAKGQGAAEVVLSKGGDGARPKISLVVATFNRLPLLERLLRQLDAQTLPPAQFEVVVVDDGSKEPVAGPLDTLEVRYPLRVLRQANAGVAKARHQGVLHARGDILAIVDDDMQVPPEFLQAHLDAHQGEAPRVVLGRMRPDSNLAQMPVFERFHAGSLEKWATSVKSGALKVVGNNLCTGNVSMRREDYLAVGGFDQTLERSEDAELGLRLEKRGVTLTFAEEPYTTHSSDHTQLARWLGRCYRYGLYELRIARKHPDLIHADPWRYLFSLHPVLRPGDGAQRAGPEALRAAGAGDDPRGDGGGQGGAGARGGARHRRGVRDGVLPRRPHRGGLHGGRPPVAPGVPAEGGGDGAGRRRPAAPPPRCRGPWPRPPAWWRRCRRTWPSGARTRTSTGTRASGAVRSRRRWCRRSACRSPPPSG